MQLENIHKSPFYSYFIAFDVGTIEKQQDKCKKFVDIFTTQWSTFQSIHKKKTFHAS